MWMRLRILLPLLAVLAFAVPSMAKADQLIYVRADHSSGVTKAQLDTTIPAFQKLITNDFAPIWGTDATLTTDPKLAPVANMQINLLGFSDMPGALGYHEVFVKPVSYVFVKESEKYNEAWPLVFSHELEEMLADPWIDRVSQDPVTGRMWAVEVADPVQDGFYALWIDGLPMSDFVTPAWFGTGAPGPFDFLGFLKNAHKVGRHSYSQWYDFYLQRWHAVWGFHAKSVAFRAFPDVERPPRGIPFRK
jgi:hypothetical protein